VTTIDRRTFLRRSAAMGLVFGGGASWLAACGDDDDGGGEGEGTSELSIQFSWIYNTEFAGAYLANENGFYEDEGFTTVNLLTGGPTVPVEPVVISGQALFGYTFAEPMSGAVLEGADLKVIAALYQTNPFCIMSLASNPIRSLDDMLGKRVGVQAVNEPIWDALLSINNIDPAEIDKIPAEFDPAPMVNGEADGWFSFVINEPITLNQGGTPAECMMLADHGFNLQQQLFITTADNLANRKDDLVRAVRAELRGWQLNAQDPVPGAELAVNEWGSDLGLTLEHEVAENEEQIRLMLNDDTEANGLGYMTEERIASNVELLGAAGLEISADVFTTEILDEVYKDGTDLLG
jgi:ABC-type nitrate/sulfonate/bicarbonate transport system substrate-binding protein